METQRYFGLDPSLHQASDVCRAIHGEDFVFCIRLLKRDQSDGLVKKAEHVHGTLAEHCRKFPAWKADGLEPFVLVACTDGTGASREHIIGSWAVAVDLDFPVDMNRWKESVMRPTIAINTSRGRQHFVWILDQYDDRASCHDTVIALAARLGGDMCFANSTQAIRLPNFVNHKYGTEVALSFFEEGLYRNHAKLREAFDFELVKASLTERIPRLGKSLRLIKTEVSEEHLCVDLRAALEHISSDDYGVWIKCLGALTSLGQVGFDIAEEWSKKSEKFDPGRMKVAWDSLSKGSTTTPSSIFFMAAKNGWRNPGRRQVTAQSRDPLTERSLGKLLAEAMGFDVAAARVGRGDKQTLQPLRWDGCKFAPLDQFEFRACVEQYCAKLSFGEDADQKRVRVAEVARHTGDGRSLDAAGRSALEFLLSRSDSLQATHFPYFPVENGILNLVSGELIPDYIRGIANRRSKVVFDPDAVAPKFQKFVEQIFEGDEDRIAFFFRLIGSILLGKPVDHLFLIFYGPTGRNGKSVMAEILMALFGEFACTLGVSAVMVKGTMTDGATPALAKLEGKRLVIINEPNGKHQLDSGLVKQLTGGDRVTARALYGNEVEFLPEFTPIMVTNFMPKIQAADEALWARIRIIPFRRTFSPDEIDLGLKDKLLAELPGILNMFLAGLSEYLKCGLQAPDEVVGATRDERRLLDGFAAWIDARTTVSSDKIQYTFLREDYVAWAKENPEFEKLSSREFSAKLTARFEKSESRHYVFYSGLSLIDASAV